MIAEAQRAEAELVSADVDTLEELRAAFDDIRPLNDEADSSIDKAPRQRGSNPAAGGPHGGSGVRDGHPSDGVSRTWRWA
ncbi:hypothetical protein DIJ64_10630 [Mycobacterium leprae]|uniref:Uncharacterized protein n=1 Tax=Mycobacterium leprae TaxID=1769 RepID=A0AAD0KUX4_MYCLR|nr:hypothetical protein [Mycobacterium leprae]AWV48348.1 hypothetical protein DIJ64_10630 [Mycobacterium leprae]OAR20159.1 hypothetical protein A8144_11920 [Mycobacterium leprae 3125609]OAX70510.1 hypothetical protein A3216_11555 [Mycobacterium leprae 7935681]